MSRMGRAGYWAGLMMLCAACPLRAQSVTPTPAPTPQTVSLAPAAGSVTLRESAGNLPLTYDDFLRAGDDADNRAFQAIFGYDLGALPAGARIVAARVEVMQNLSRRAGDPYGDLGDLYVERAVLDNEAPLSIARGPALAGSKVLFRNTIDSRAIVDVTEIVRGDQQAARRLTRLRLRFLRISDGDRRADQIEFSPRALTIVYQSGASPTPTPIGGGAERLVFVSQQSPNASLVTMNADGTARRVLTSIRNGAFDSPAWNGQGTRIVFGQTDYICEGELCSITDSPSFIWSIDADGFNRRRLTNGPFDSEPSFSADGTRIAFVRRTEYYGASAIWTMNADGSNQKRIGAGSSPTWSGDGRVIMFVGDRGGSSQIFLMNADGTGTAPLRNGEFFDETHPRFSPDNKQIVYATGGGIGVFPAGNLRLVSVNGSGDRALTNGNLSTGDPSWRPDGQRIVSGRASFNSTTQGSFSGIESIDPRSGGRDALTQSTGYDYAPAFRPVQSTLRVPLPPPLVFDLRHKIVFATESTFGNGYARNSLAVMERDGTNVQRLFTSTYIDQFREPAVSPDARRIAFSGYDAVRGALIHSVFLSDADGSNRRVLRYTYGDRPFAPSPTWNPDGSQLAYAMETEPRADTEIMVQSLDGQPRALTNNDVGDDDPAWSPDGRHIAFVSERNGSKELYVMNADGSDPRRLTDSVGENLQPAWSADSRKIVFVSTRDGNEEIYILKLQTGELLRLTNNAFRDNQPVWDTNGERIIFASNRGTPQQPNGANPEIYAMDLAGENVERLTTNPKFDGYPTLGPTF